MHANSLEVKIHTETRGDYVAVAGVVTGWLQTLFNSKAKRKPDEPTVVLITGPDNAGKTIIVDRYILAKDGNPEVDVPVLKRSVIENFSAEAGDRVVTSIVRQCGQSIGVMFASSFEWVGSIETKIQEGLAKLFSEKKPIDRTVFFASACGRILSEGEIHPAIRIDLADESSGTFDRDWTITINDCSLLQKERVLEEAEGLRRRFARAPR